MTTTAPHGDEEQSNNGDDDEAGKDGENKEAYYDNDIGHRQ